MSKKAKTPLTPLSVEPLEGETWLPVVGYEKYYRVSNLGRVASLDRVVIHASKIKQCSRFQKGRLLKQNGVASHGYFHVNLSVGGVQIQKLVHRLVGEVFVLNPGNKPQINHKDGVRKNNVWTNLEWVTNGENSKHSWDVLGHLPNGIKGEQAFNAKLTDSAVIEIRSSDESLMAMARKFGVSKRAVCLARQRKTWRHV